MPALIGFIVPAAPTPVIAPAKPAPTVTVGPPSTSTPKNLFTGKPHPKSRPAPPPVNSPALPPPPPPPAIAVAGGAAAGGLGILSLPVIVALALLQLIFFEEPLSRDQGNVPQPAEPSKEIEPPNVPFKGGQSKLPYHIEGIATIIYDNRPNGARYSVTHTYNTALSNKYTGPQGAILGPILGIDSTYKAGGGTDYGISLAIRHVDDNVYPGYIRTTYLKAGTSSPDIGFYNFAYNTVVNAQITKVYRNEPVSDTGGDPPPLAPAIIAPPGNSLGAPSPAPPSTAPLPAPKAPPPYGIPGKAPSPFPNGDPEPKRAPSPNPFPSPKPAPKPGSAPQPEKYPNFTPAPSPAPAPSGAPGPSPGPGVEGGTPGPAPRPAPTEWGNRTPLPADPTKYPDTGFQPNIFQPNPLTAPPDFKPNPLEPRKFTPKPGTGEPEPEKKAPTEAPTTPNPLTPPNEDLFKKIQNLIGPLAIIVAGITPLLHPDKLKEAANAGSCQSFAPGGCNAGITTNAADAAANSAKNNTLLAQIMAFLQALQAAFMVPILAGVNLINTKLGPVMAGVNGIGGFLARAAEAAKLNKVLNAMNTVLLLHNAAMLSRNLGSPLGDLTSQALSTIGIKDGDSPIDVNSILGKQANSFMASLLGAEVWAGTKTSWNKASSIIATTTNIMYTMRSMFDSAREVMEWTAENTGKIGNSLKRFRVVGENAFKWMPERLTVQNKFTQRLDKFRDGTESLDDAASSLQGVLGEVGSIQSEYAELQEAKQKFDTNIKDLTPKVREDNKPVADAVIAAKTASSAPVTTENVFRGEGSLPDA